jgi:hypothetical protein
MAALTTQRLNNTGAAPSFGNSSASDTAEVGNGANTFVVYKNTGGSNAVVTIVVPGTTTYGETTPDKVVTVPLTSGEKWIPLRKEYSDPAVAGVGRCTITATNSGATLQVAVVQVG